MELLRSLSDNQLAVAGSMGALFISFVLMSGSFHLGRMLRAHRDDAAADGAQTVRAVNDNSDRSRNRRAA